MDRTPVLTVSGLRLFEGEILGRIYGHGIVEVFHNRELEKLHNEKLLHSLYAL
jgi:hypothetical protein